MTIGLIGCGKWGKFILRDLVRLHCRVTVMAVDDTSREQAQAYGAARIVSSIKALVKQDGYIICTPSTTRYSLIQELMTLDSAAIIFAEKPLCADADEAEQLAQQHADSLFVMDKWRYHAGVAALKKLILSNEFGPLRYMSTKRLSDGVTYSEIDSVWLLAPHDLSIALELLGYLPAPSFARLDVAHGCVRGLQACLGTAPYVLLNVSDRHPSSVREVAVYFEQAVAILANSHEAFITIYPTQAPHTANSPGREKRPFSPNEPLYDELQAFLAFIASGTPLKSSVAEGALVVKTIARLIELSQV